MAKEKQSQDQRIDQFFSGPGARADHWRFLVDAAKACKAPLGWVTEGRVLCGLKSGKELLPPRMRSLLRPVSIAG